MKMHISTILVLAGLASISARPPYRLPTSVVPTHYTLDIITFLEPEFRYYGEVTIKVTCSTQTRNITLNAQGLNITSSGVYVKQLDKKEARLSIKDQFSNQDYSFYTVELAEDLIPGREYALRIPFDGILSDKVEGYFKVNYFDYTANATRWLAATQMEPIEARRAFPCFDEPGLRARFAITLGHEERVHAMSNMPLSRTRPMKGKEGWVWSSFQETLPMSTFLVAYVVGNLDHVVSQTSRKDLSVSIWAKPESMKLTSFAVDFTPKIIKYAEDYFEMKIPLSKIDFVALPQFDGEGMENWGLVICNEDRLLLDYANCHGKDETDVAFLITHEVVHKWFGNLVNLDWWDEAWLKEGFATLFGRKLADRVNPSWKLLMVDSLRSTFNTFESDSLNNTRPIQQEMTSLSQILEMFDDTAYVKGSLINLMMNTMVGEETFRKGLVAYLKKFQYKTANRYDLWECLTDQAHKDDTLEKSFSMQAIIEPWVSQPGYPLITVTRDYNTGKATVSQRRYMQGSLKTHPWPQCWWVPLSLTSAGSMDFDDLKPRAWLGCQEKTIELDMPPSDQWVLFNIRLSNLYRVNYDLRNWELISKTLNSEKNLSVPVENRAQIVGDVFQLAFNGYLDYKTALGITKYLKNEKEYGPWLEADRNLDKINSLLFRSRDYSAFERFMHTMLGPIYEVIGGLRGQPQSLDEAYRNIDIVKWARRMSVGNFREDSRNLFKSWMNESDSDETNPIKKDLRKDVYCAAVEDLGEQAWNFLLERYQLSDEDELEINYALGCSREPRLLKKYLVMSMNGSLSTGPDTKEAFEAILDNPIGFLICKDFLFNKFDHIYDYHGRAIRDLIKTLAKGIATEAEKNELVSFLALKKDVMGKLQKSIDWAMYPAEMNVLWTMNYREEFVASMSTCFND